MPILPILTFPNSLLRKKAKPVKIIDDELKDLILDMTDTLKHAQGVGLAANQVGVLAHPAQTAFGCPSLV